MFLIMAFLFLDSIVLNRKLPCCLLQYLSIVKNQELDELTYLFDHTLEPVKGMNLKSCILKLYD